MSASLALKETRVPQQVTARVQRSIARYTPAEPDAPNPADGAAPTPASAAPPATPANIQAEPPADPRHADPKYWQQRFDVTSGLLAREREQRLGERNTLNSQITELQTEVQSLKQLVEKTAPPAEIDLKQFFTDAQIETYGEEQCRVMAQGAMKAASSEAQKLIDAAVRPLKQQRETDAASEVERRKNAFVDKLAELVPDWQVTDKDQRWLDWLEEEDEHGATRQSILTAHIQAANASGAAKMFKAFAKTIAVPVPHVAPSGTGAGAGDGAPPPNPGLTAPSDAEVKLFFKNSALGKVKDSERVEFEARMKLRSPRR